MIIAATGHRPQKLGGFGLSGYLHKRLVDLAKAALKKYNPTRVISGMALGWDQAVAEATMELGIPWTAAIPFEGQESMWPAEAQAKYHELLAGASEIVVVSPGGYSAQKFHVRDRWMVDHADMVLALWNGSPSGTGSTVQYAISKDMKVVNVWKSWLKYM